MSFGSFCLLIINRLYDFLYAVGPNIGYIHQSFKIYKLKKASGFSKTVPLILIFSFSLRIFFWIGERFGAAVLANAILGILTQLLLLYVLVKYSHKKTNSDIFNIKEFWNWPYYFDYILFLSFCVVCMSLISNFFGYDNKYYIFCLGTASALIEATLDLPQVIEICKTNNPNTISYLLVFSWFCGDMFKLGYYVLRKQPLQLIGCAAFQICTDTFVVCQIAYLKIFGNKNTNRDKENLILQKH